MRIEEEIQDGRTREGREGERERESKYSLEQGKSVGERT